MGGSRGGGGALGGKKINDKNRATPTPPAPPPPPWDRIFGDPGPLSKIHCSAPAVQAYDLTHGRNNLSVLCTLDHLSGG